MFDVNCAIGHWPFRRLTRNTLPELKDYLQSYSITGAAVTHNHAACYINTHDANIELYEAIQADKDQFFVGIATLNPTYPAWERDLATCVEKFGFRGVRILPQYHNYLLTSRASWEIIDAAAEYDIPVVIPKEVVNYRQHSWLEPLDFLKPGELLATVSRHPDTKFLITETELPLAASYPDNLYVEMSRFQCCHSRKLDRYIAGIGAEHVLYGSGAPFREIESSLLKMHHVQISDTERALIEDGNARKLFGLVK